MTFWIMAALSALAAVDAPVTEVTVFSDRARVTRTATVALDGTKALELPPLPDTVDAASLQVEAQGATVVRVDLSPLRPEEMPKDQARAFLEKLSALDDRITLLSAQAQAYREEAQAQERIAPVVPQAEPLRPQPRLESAGWAQAMAFLSSREAEAQQKARALDEKVKALNKERDRLAQEARLAGGTARHGGWKVVPTLEGHGPATVKITYLAGPARWIPSYDLQLDPSTGKVRVAFSGQVSQETTEDWTDARLRLSTAVPDQAVQMPRLATWKIGERDRFIPTPVAQPPQVVPVRQPPPPIAEVDTAVLWRQRLQARVNGAAPAEPEVEAREDASDSLFGSAGAKGYLSGGVAGGVSAGALGGPAAPYPQNRPRPRRAIPSAPPPPPSAQAAPSAAMPSMQARSMEETLAVTGSAPFTQPPTAQFNLAPPSVWVPPTYAPNLPASLAGGYDLAWTSLAKETVESGKGARSVALFSQQWPVTVERKVFPALAQEAYLVAELKSPSPTPLPGGTAQLYVGADPTGHATLDLVSPGETFTLPLGLDRALKPIRNVELVSAEKGVFSKDDVNRYVVTTELANPYPRPIAVKIFDQWPRTDDANVEVELVSTKPWAKQDTVEGSLEWDLTLPASGKTTVTFTYTLRRPKNWRLHQK